MMDKFGNRYANDLSPFTLYSNRYPVISRNLGNVKLAKCVSFVRSISTICRNPSITRQSVSCLNDSAVLRISKLEHTETGKHKPRYQYTAV